MRFAKTTSVPVDWLRCVCIGGKWATRSTQSNAPQCSPVLLNHLPWRVKSPMLRGCMGNDFHRNGMVAYPPKS